MNIRSDIVRVYKEIHTWVGISCGLFLFIGFYAGSITLFEQPLQRWASPPINESSITPLNKAPILIAKALAEHPGAMRNFNIILNPRPDQPARMHWEQRATAADDHAPAQQYYADLTQEGEITIQEQGPSPVAQLIDTIHQQLGLLFDHEWVMPLVGLISLLYGLALISGTVVLLPTLIKDAFALRLGKNLKRMWLDIHNLLGVFSLPFHLVIALTSVVFALHDYFYDAQKETIYHQFEKPAKSQAQKPIRPKQPKLIVKDLVPVDTLLKKVKDQYPDYTPIHLNYRMIPGNKFAVFVAGLDPKHHSARPRVGLLGLDPYTGDVISTDYMPGYQASWNATVSSFFTLHFGNYGGNYIRWCYFILGISGAFLFYTGNLLWIEKRRKKHSQTIAGGNPSGQNRSCHIIGAITLGVTLGCVSGISFIIALSKLLPSISLNHTLIYYTIFVGSILWALLRGSAKGAVELLYIAAVTTALIPLASLFSLVTPNFGWNHFDSTTMVDVIASFTVMCLLLLARKTTQRIASAPYNSIWFDPNTQGKAVALTASQR